MEILMPNPSVLVAEDSKLAEVYSQLLKNEFHVTLAQSGEMALAAIDLADQFDLCLIDIILPVEAPTMPISEAQTTGLRLIKRLLDQKKCSRFLVVTVRPDIRADLDALLKKRADYRLLLKYEASTEEILAAAKDLMALPTKLGHSSTRAWAATLEDLHESLRVAIQDKEQGPPYIIAFLLSLMYLFKVSLPERAWITEKHEKLFASCQTHVRSLWINSANEDVQEQAQRTLAESDAFAQRHALFQPAN